MTITERLSTHSIPIPESGCRVWEKGVSRGGYGKITVNGRTRLVHRLAWEQIYGQVPNGLFVCHHCDVPSCLNVDHLFIGTAKDNFNDARMKGRVLNPSQCAHISAVNTGNTIWAGKTHTIEARKKISESKKGKQPWLGRTHTLEARAKMSLAKKGRKPWLGKTHSEQSRAKISLAAKNRTDLTRGMNGQFLTISSVTGATSSAISNATAVGGKGH